MDEHEAERGRAADKRHRILAGLEQVLAERPFAEIAVADIVAAAGTSKRAFYESYPHKAACLVDHVDTFHEQFVAELEAMVLAASDPLAGVRLGVESFLLAVRERPLLFRAHLVDVYALGSEGVRVRLGAKERYVELLQKLADLDDGTERVELDTESAMSLLGALDDVAVRVAFGDPDDAAYDRIVDSTVRLVRAVFIGLWVERTWGPIDLQRLAADAAPTTAAPTTS